MTSKNFSWFKNKRGDLTDVILYTVLITILSLGFIIIAFIIPQITSGINTIPINESADVVNAINSLERFGTVGIQRGVFFLSMGLIMAFLVSAFFVRTHPIFLFLYIIFLGLAVMMGTFMGNLYDTATSNPIFAETLASQGLINVTMNNIVLITLGFGALSIIIVFSKFSSLAGGNRL